MNVCIYKKTPFENSDGEHILQNFLGARWVSSKIVCNEAQAHFGASIDVALEKGLQEVRNLLGTKGGRGGDGPILKGIFDTDGTKYNLNPGGQPQISAPVIKSQDLEDGAELLEGKVGNKSQLAWLLHELKQTHPNVNININQLKAMAISQRGYLNSRLHLRSGIGGADYFRGLLKAAFNLLGANASHIALMDCFDNLRKFILDGTGSADMFVRWYSSVPSETQVPTLGKFDHFLCVYSNGRTIDGMVAFFGGIGHTIRLANEYEGEAFKFGYLVNPLRDTDPAEMREPQFNIDSLPRFEDGYTKPGPEVRQIYISIYDNFLANHSVRSISMEISRIINDARSSDSFDTNSEQFKKDICLKIAHFIHSRVSKIDPT